MKVIDIMKEISSAYYPFWMSNKPYNVLKGGRSSMKSSAISLKLVTEFMKNDLGNVICFRLVGSSLELSVYEQIKWAIDHLGYSNQFRNYKSPLRIVHKRTKTAFFFAGVDDPQKLKGVNISKGYFMAAWFEEANDFDVLKLDQVKPTLTRKKLPDGKVVKLYYSYNPPRDPYDEFNQWVESMKDEDDYFFLHTTYLDDEHGFLSDQIKEDIERYKRNDYDYYRWLYLGEVVGLGNQVFNMDNFKPMKREFDGKRLILPDNDRLVGLYFGGDTGYANSATTFGCLGLTLKRKVILLDTYYYSPKNKTNKKAPSDFSKDLHDFIKKQVEMYPGIPIRSRIVDSADAAIRNEYAKMYGQYLTPVAKKKNIDMIAYVQDLMAQGRFYYFDIPENKVAVTEMRGYKWDEKTMDSGKPEVIKVDDHVPDMIKYIVLMNLRDFNLKN